MMQFERYTERAQDALMRAYEILHRFQHSQADTEHLFLALVEQPDGMVRQILGHLNADIEKMRADIEATLQRARAQVAPMWTLAHPARSTLPPA